jgi:hypothetical protein
MLCNMFRILVLWRVVSVGLEALPQCWDKFNRNEVVKLLPLERRRTDWRVEGVMQDIYGPYISCCSQ